MLYIALSLVLALPCAAEFEDYRGLLEIVDARVRATTHPVLDDLKARENAIRQPFEARRKEVRARLNAWETMIKSHEKQVSSMHSTMSAEETAYTKAKQALILEQPLLRLMLAEIECLKEHVKAVCESDLFKDTLARDQASHEAQMAEAHRRWDEATKRAEQERRRSGFTLSTGRLEYLACAELSWHSPTRSVACQFGVLPTHEEIQRKEFQYDAFVRDLCGGCAYTPDPFYALLDEARQKTGCYHNELRAIDLAEQAALQHVFNERRAFVLRLREDVTRALLEANDRENEAHAS